MKPKGFLLQEGTCLVVMVTSETSLDYSKKCRTGLVNPKSKIMCVAVDEQVEDK